MQLPPAVSFKAELEGNMCVPFKPHYFARSLEPLSGETAAPAFLLRCQIVRLSERERKSQAE